MDKPRPGRPRSKRTPENIQKMRELIQDNPRQSLKELSAQTDMSTHAVRQTLTKDLCLKRRAPKFIPTDLSDSQKETRKEVCDKNIELVCSQEDPNEFMKTIITGDETWISTHEPETKKESMAWTKSSQPRLKKPLQYSSAKRTMLTVFFDCKGVVLCEFLGKKETIDSKRYCQTLSNLKECMRKKRPELWADKVFDPSR